MTRLRSFLTYHKARAFLLFCAFVNLAGALARLPHLPPSHPYFLTLAATFILAIVSLFVTLYSSLAGINLFVWLGSLLIFLAAQAEKQLHPEYTFSVLLAMPTIGLLALAHIERHEDSTLIFSKGAAIITALMLMKLYDRPGEAFMAASAIFLLGLVSSAWCQKDNALTRLKVLERGLSGVLWRLDK